MNQRDVNRKNLKNRLEDVGLDLYIYKTRPKKFIRINPRCPIKINELKKKLHKNYTIKVKFKEINIKGIYESTNTNIGGWINGKRNKFFNKNYFIQDLASIICVKELDLHQGQSLLDLCAARGFKSILAHDLTKGKIKITALDIDNEKYKIMLKFFKKFRINAETHLIDSTKFKSQKYDRVLVDVPCSSEGMTFVYNEKLKRDVSGLDNVLQYSQQDVKKFSKLQERLLQNGFNHLKKGGILIYATCTLNKIENENVIDKFLRKNNDALVFNPNMRKYGIGCKVSRLGVRILPEKTKGFYFTKIIKK